MGQRTRVSGIGPVIFTALAVLFTFATAALLAMLFAGSEYSKEPVTQVVAATHDVPALSPITADDVRLVKVPMSAVPDGALTKIEDAVATPPKRSMASLRRGEILVGPRMAEAEQGQGIASFVPKGKRAVVVRTELAAALARTFHPGATVDVLATVRLEGQNETLTRTILQAVRILAIGTAVDPSYLPATTSARAYSGSDVEEKDTVVTLLTTLDQAEILTLAAREGRIDLVLRNPDDRDRVQTAGVSPADMFPEAEGEDDDDRRSVRRSTGGARRYVRRSGGSDSGGQASAPTIEIR